MATRALSRQRILKAAFAIADRQGVEAVTMRSVAAKLDVEAMSLYHHVPSKKAMLDGLVDLLVQVAALPEGDVTIEEWVRGAADGLRALAQKHPRLVAVLSLRSVPLDDPKAARPFESGLAAFVARGCTLPQAYASLQAVLISLLAMAQLEATSALEAESQEYSDVVALPAAEFPLLHEISETGVGLDEFWGALVTTLVVGFTS